MVLFCLPLAMFGYLYFANRSYIDELTASIAGILLLVGGGVLMVRRRAVASSHRSAEY